MLVLCMALMAAGPSTGDAAPGFSLAVMGFKSEGGISEATAGALTDIFTQRMRDSTIFTRVTSARELETVLGLEARRQSMNCDSDSCLAELAGALGVDYVAQSLVGKVGDSFVLTLRIIDRRNGSAISSVTQTVTGGEQAILAAMDPACIQLIQGIYMSGKKPRMPPPVEKKTFTGKPRAEPVKERGTSPLAMVGAGVLAGGGALLLLGVATVIAGGVMLAAPYFVGIPTPVHGAGHALLLTLVPSGVLVLGVLGGLVGMGLAAAGAVSAGLGMRGGA